jgi:hypothetical protein
MKIKYLLGGFASAVALAALYTWSDSILGPIFWPKGSAFAQIRQEYATLYLRANLTGDDLPTDKFYYTPKMVGHYNVKLSNNFTAAELKLASTVEIRMKPNEAAFLARKVSNAKVYFEYGCGGSTKLVCPLGVKMYSMDSDAAWLESLKSMNCIKDGVQGGRVKLIHTNIGPIGKWGRPVDSSHKDLWPHYSNALVNVKEPVDVILVDGRFRLACVLASFLAQPHAIVILHDFYRVGQFQKYSPILDVADVVDGASTLVQLQRKKGASDAKLRAMLETYKYIND